MISFTLAIAKINVLDVNVLRKMNDVYPFANANVILRINENFITCYVVDVI